MKAVIVECSNGAAVALCDDGSFRKLKNKGYSIGQELLIKQKHTPNRMVQKLSICASLALVLLSFAGIGSHSYVEPYSYVSLDINPSIEYALNRYDKVISVAGINTEGQQVVSSIEADIKNQNITTALGVTIGQLEKEHYIMQETYNHVIVSVYSTNDTKAQSIASRVNSFSAEKSDICSIDTIPVSKEVKDDADSLGITPGKLALIHAVAETTSDSNFDVSEWTNKSVSELETTIQQASSQTPDSGAEPAAANVVNSDYLSSVLDNNAANKPESSTASVVDAEQGAGSASADKQTTTTDDTTTGSGTSGTASAPKPDNSGNTIAPAASGSADSAQKPDASNPSGTGSSTSNQDQTNTSDKNTSPGKGDSSGTSSTKPPASSDQTNSPEKGDSSDTGSSNDKNDAMTEDSSNKKDPYPLPDQSASEETPPQEDASGKVDPPSNEGSSSKDDTSTDDTLTDDILHEDTSSKNHPYTDSSTSPNNPDSNTPDSGSPDSDTVSDANLPDDPSYN
ncbi:MAG: hypothetical protein K2N87_03265 [Eubacterium sp.]|nr:hypothetical protein [Eubacterium sp.]